MLIDFWKRLNWKKKQFLFKKIKLIKSSNLKKVKLLFLKVKIIILLFNE